ncbi:ubiquinol-cytochrome c reductase complex 7.3 kda protein-like protein [Pseudovirgaria hyperparasitica]|uniref:Complex III subunit 9 n=1 Tax=Pseudovirgaria hyperparasitica TaxID=470096 RepID=A0A6A6VSP1_9PEZI|nr:ubiquinol-cytochrome c reductase complex 7.3 kda protein-like protein [Pseudovirgaria hyperparasitica]KAF2753688.1 ubiquinol-cytochrome c reductase complex 7.3 kda protein-like protein [Pseudovirgaria hyperparasitica]
MPLSNTIYNSLFRRNTTMLFTVFATAFGIQLAFDTGSERLWSAINRGRQWQDVKPIVMARAEGGDDDEEE